VREGRGDITKVPIAASLALLFAVLAALQFGYPESGLLYLAPALLLLTALVFGRYPGERLLLAAAGPGRNSLRRHRQQTPIRRAFPLTTHPRGGALLGCALAGRAPPR
jgi:hypothetical protein